MTVYYFATGLLCLLVRILGRAAGQTNESLQFINDARQGDKTWITPASGGASFHSSYQAIEYYYPTMDTTGAVVGGNWHVFETVRPGISAYIFSRPHGLCVSYPFRVRLTDGSYGPVQNLTIPTAVLDARSSGLSSSQLGIEPITSIDNNIITAQTSARTIVASFFWGNQLLYWTGVQGIRIAEEKPWVKLLRCESLFDQHVPGPQLFYNGRRVRFQEQHAIHNCTFQFGVNFTVSYSGEISPTNGVSKPSCSHEFTVAAMELTVNCGNVRGLVCASTPEPCDMDCDPLTIDSTVVQQDRRFGETIPAELLKIFWVFSPETRAKTIEYQVRQSTVDIGENNTYHSERDVSQKSINRLINYVEGQPPSGSWVNYSIQVCALAQTCTQSIRWNLQKKFQVEFKSAFYYLKDDPPSIVRPASFLAFSRCAVLTFDVKMLGAILCMLALRQGLLI